MAQLAEVAIGFLIGGIFSSAQIFGRCSPFGVAAVAAAGSGLVGFMTLLGAVGGYIFFLGMEQGLRYGAAAILIYAIQFALHDMKLSLKKWFLPAVSALLCGLTSFISLSARGWYAADVIFFFTELALLAGTAYIYRWVMQGAWGKNMRVESLTTEEKIGYLAAAATVLIALNGIQFWGGSWRRSRL